MHFPDARIDVRTKQSGMNRRKSSNTWLLIKNGYKFLKIGPFFCNIYIKCSASMQLMHCILCKYCKKNCQFSIEWWCLILQCQLLYQSIKLLTLIVGMYFKFISTLLYLHNPDLHFTSWFPLYFQIY